MSVLYNDVRYHHLVTFFTTLFFGVLRSFIYVQGKQSGSNVFKIVKMIMERNYAPVIIFSFSKKECEGYALQMSKLNTGKLHPLALVSADRS